MRATLALFAAVLSSCAGLSPDFPPPLTEAEARNLGLSQGIAGRAAMRSGDCMPGMGFRTCAVVRVPMELVAFPADALVAASGECEQGVSATSWRSFQLLSDAQPAARANLAKVEVYQLPLEPGSYQLLLVDENGCAACSRASPDSERLCLPTDVEPSRITLFDVFLDDAVY